MTALVAVAVVLVAARCFYLLRYPWGPCWRCKGRKTNKGSNAKRWGMCKTCGGTGQRRRFGATAVHRLFWSVLGTILHDRFKKRIEKAQQKARYPE